MSKKAKNYADLENARVFLNPKSNIIEVTGRYADGSGNFATSLQPGSKSDLQARAVFATQKAGTTVDEESTRHLPPSAQVIYSDDLQEDVYREGSIFRSEKYKDNVFYLPFLEEGKSHLFPLGMDMDGNPVLIDLHSGEKRNILLANSPGSGGLMSLHNLMVHILRAMPETTLVSNEPDIVDFYNRSPWANKERSKHLSSLALVEHLRNIHGKMSDSRVRDEVLNEVILIENLEHLVDSNINAGPTQRTDKAVRAETIELILEISKMKHPRFNITFVFSARYLNDRMNAFVESCGTLVTFSRKNTTVGEAEYRKKIFGQDLHELNYSSPGSGFIKNENYKDGDFFATFLNPEVIEFHRR
jgi:hypothetical protein